MPDISKEQASYLAGFIDADGHIGVVRRHREGTQKLYLRPIIQIGQAKRLPLDWIAGTVGEGSVHIHGKRGFYNLRFHAGALRWLLPALLPYLVLKRRQAELVMEFLELSAVSRNGVRLSDFDLARREAIRAECEVLNTKPGAALRKPGDLTLVQGRAG